MQRLGFINGQPYLALHPALNVMGDMMSSCGLTGQRSDVSPQKRTKFLSFSTIRHYLVWQEPKYDEQLVSRSVIEIVGVV